MGDSACAESASLGHRQRKLFLDTIRTQSEPDRFIFVDTNDAISNKAHSMFAVVEVDSETAKYADLKALDGSALHSLITDNTLSINRGVYLFFNRIYKTHFIDIFLE